MNHKDDFTKAGTLENLPSPSKGNPFPVAPVCAALLAVSLGCCV